MSSLVCGIDGIDIPILQAAVISETSFRSNGNIAVNSDGSATLVQESQFIGNGVGIRSFFLSNPSNALAYRANMFSANGTNLIGGFSLGANYCSGVAC